MTFEQIKAAAFGAVRIEERDGNVFFHRFIADQEEMYKNRNTDFYKATFATAGVSLEFDTDSENLDLSVEISDGSYHNVFAHSIFVNNNKVGELCGELESGVNNVLLNGKFNLGEKYLKRVKIVFPWSVCSVIKEIKLDEGSKFIPLQKERKVIIFGDSITHGYYAESPENSYVSRLAEMLDADIINKGIGGEIFCPELVFRPDNFQPDFIIVAYGTNDWNGTSKELFEQDCFNFFKNLHECYPGVQIFALSPIWRVDVNDKKSVGLLTYVDEYLRKVADDIANIIVIDGLNFVPHKTEYFADGSVHPNDDGFKCYAENLYKELKKYILKPKEKLKINFLGDSITQGAGASKYENCYVKLVERKMDAVCRNYGIGGTRIAQQLKPSIESVYDQDFCSRIKQMDADANVVVVFGGTNDFGHGDAPIGTIDDRTPNTFYGALHVLYKNLIEKYPDAFIFIITPLHRVDENNPRGEGNKEKVGLLLREYVQIIREVADYYSLPVLDLFADSGVYPLISAHREKYTSDGLHPNDDGHAIIARRVTEFIEKYYKNTY